MESSPLSQSTTVTDKLQQDEGKKHNGKINLQLEFTKNAEFKEIKNTFQHHPITPCNKFLLLDEFKSNMQSEFSYHDIDL
jgi:hypothetical protein